VLKGTSDGTRLDEQLRVAQERVSRLASDTLGRGANPPHMDEPLYGTEAGFDSIALMEFILHLEDEFGISIPDEDLDPEIFYSISTVATYVLRRLDARTSSS
jgi:acyl carrier protein